MKTFDQLREGHPDNKKEDSDAVKAFLAKGGKIKKLPPAKAQGYHGKDDPGKGMHGMLDKPDTKKIGTRKKVKSMEGVDEELQVYRVGHKSVGGNVHAKSHDDAMAKLRAKGVKGKITLTHRGSASKAIPSHSKTGKPMASTNENYQVQKYTDGKKDGPPKSFGGDLKKATAHANKMGGDHRVHKEAKRTVTIDRPDRLTSLRVSKDKPPFDNPKPIQKNTKDKFGNPIKNRAKHLARKAARDLLNKSKNESYLGHSDAEKLGKSRDSSHDNAASHIDYHLRRHPNASTASGGERDKLRHQVAKKLGYNVESSYDKLNKYNKDAQASKDKATNSAVATILRKGDHSKDLNTMRKRERGLKMVKSRITDKIRKGHKK
jgi:hypothetical protein